MPEQDLAGEVLRLRSAGLSDDEVAQRLLYQGYSHAAVFDALSQANVNPVFEEPTKMPYEETPAYPNYPPAMMPEVERPLDVTKISEIAESIIEEKWSDLVDHVNRIIEWKSTMELKLASMEEQIKNMKSDFDILHKGILGRIGESDTIMREISIDIKALEQVFKKILPGFVENVNELSRITQTLKKTQSK